MDNNLKRRVGIAIVGVVVIAGVWGTVKWRGTGWVTRTVEGTIVELDPATRRATLEVIHPKTGEPIRIPGRVPPECSLEIDGAPARLADLRIGDTAKVRGSIGVSKQISVEWVKVFRTRSPNDANGPGLAPATAPATTSTADPA